MDEMRCWFSHLSAQWERANVLQHWCSCFVRAAWFPVLLFPPSSLGLIPNLPFLPPAPTYSSEAPFRVGPWGEPVAEPEEEEEMLQHLLCFLCPWQASAVLPDQRPGLGREAEGGRAAAGGSCQPCSPFPTLPTWKDASQHCTWRVRTHCEKMCSKWSRLTREGEKPWSDSTGEILVGKCGHLA